MDDADLPGGLEESQPAASQPVIAANATVDAITEDSMVATGLESLAARSSILPSLPQHRLAASSIVLMLLLLLAAFVLILAARRPVLRTRHPLPPHRSGLRSRKRPQATREDPRRVRPRHARQAHCTGDVVRGHMRTYTPFS